MFERNHLLSSILEMRPSFNVRQKQRTVIEFLVLKGRPPINIFQRLEKVHGDAAIGYSAVKKWVARIKGKEDQSLSELRDKQRSGRPSSTVNPGNSARAEELIRDDRRVTIDDIAERLRISHESAAKIVGGARLCNGLCQVGFETTYGRPQASPSRSLFGASRVSRR